MATHNIELGKDGENAACNFLSEQGYTVICRNYRASHDEIDIIAKKDKYTVFVEVKTRTDVPYTKFGRPAAAVTARKRACLARAALQYLKDDTDKTSFYRFDVIEVIVTTDRVTNKRHFNFNHMKSVFGAEGKIWI